MLRVAERKTNAVKGSPAVMVCPPGSHLCRTIHPTVANRMSKPNPKAADIEAKKFSSTHVDVFCDCRRTESPIFAINRTRFPVAFGRLHSSHHLLHFSGDGRFAVSIEDSYDHVRPFRAQQSPVFTCRFYALNNRKSFIAVKHLASLQMTSFPTGIFRQHKTQTFFAADMRLKILLICTWDEGVSVSLVGISEDDTPYARVIHSSESLRGFRWGHFSMPTGRVCDVHELEFFKKNSSFRRAFLECPAYYSWFEPNHFICEINLEEKRRNDVVVVRTYGENQRWPGLAWDRSTHTMFGCGCINRLVHLVHAACVYFNIRLECAQSVCAACVSKASIVPAMGFY